MRRKDIQADSTTEYAVAHNRESAELGEGQHAIRRCVVVAFDQERESWGDGWAATKAQDGVRVRDLDFDADDDWTKRAREHRGIQREYVVRTAAIKGLWSDHVERRESRDRADRADRERSAARTRMFKDAMTRIDRAGFDLSDGGNVNSYAEHATVYATGLQHLADVLDELVQLRRLRADVEDLHSAIECDENDGGEHDDECSHDRNYTGSGADQCSWLYELLGRHGMKVS